MDKIAVGKKIRSIRKELGQSMAKFGETIDKQKPVKSGVVSNWENGKQLPNNERSKKIAELGNMTINELFYDSPEEYLIDELGGSFFNKLDNNVDIVRSSNEYYLYICVPTNPIQCNHLNKIAGVDLGIRTFATVHSHSKEIHNIKEYKHRADILKLLNLKLNILKTKRRIRKKQLTKIEKKKSNLVDCLHWDFINDIVLNNDVIYLGDIKSHNIVKNSKIKFLNVAFNDLKFYQLKQRLIYKAFVAGKKRVPNPAAGITAFLTFDISFTSNILCLINYFLICVE